MNGSARPVPADLRTVGLGAVGWSGALLVAGGQTGLALGLVAAMLAWAAGQGCRAGAWATPLAWALAGAAVTASTLLHHAALASSPVARLAATGASAQAVVRIDSDPVATKGRFGDQVSFRARVLVLTSRGVSYRLRVPVLVLAAATGPGLRRGSTVRLAGVLRSSDRPDRAAILTTRGPWTMIAPPGMAERAAGRVRAGVREAVAGHSSGPRALVPALVDGEDAGIDDRTDQDFRTTGLTHLLAVSGTNLTIILGCVLALARRCRVRGTGLVVVGLLGVVGFILLAGPEPSVLRAAAMGSIALLGLHAGGRQQGVRALGLGVLILLLVDPWLARSAGFALSVCATAGILLLVPRWRAALARWLPVPVAEAVAVPLAAQVVCTPLIVAISSSLSLVAVLANLIVAPLVAPATVLGLAGGLVALVSESCGQVVAAPAAWSASVIIAVAHRGAALPVPALPIASGVMPVLVLTLLCVLAAARLHLVLERKRWVLLVTGVVATTVLVPLPTPGWPPSGWVFVACSVGQGDALALRAGPRSAVVVDTGPDPRLVDHCLRRLGVTAVPILVLTHFHADHVDGLDGVLHGRTIGEILTSPLADPAYAAATVGTTASRAGIPIRSVTLGETTTVGDLTWTVLGPSGEQLPDSDSPPNDASVVMLVETRGIRLLLMGDEERPSQAVLHREYPGLAADVLKVAHHGSSKQDVDLVSAVGARLGVISVGLHNDYGHPASSTLELLARAGMQVRRTDLDGDVAVVVDGAGGIASVVRGP